MIFLLPPKAGMKGVCPHTQLALSHFQRPWGLILVGTQPEWQRPNAFGLTPSCSTTRLALLVNCVSRQGNEIWAYLMGAFILVLCSVTQEPQTATTWQTDPSWRTNGWGFWPPAIKLVWLGTTDSPNLSPWSAVVTGVIKGPEATYSSHLRFYEKFIPLA